MKQAFIKIGIKQYPLRVSLRAQARHFRLRLSPVDNTILVSAPIRSTQAVIENFILNAEPWLTKAIAKRELTNFIQVKDGSIIPFLGVNHRITHIRKDEIRIEKSEGVITVFTPGRHFSKVLKNWLYQELLVQANKFCILYAQRLGCEFNSIKIKNIRSRWGSCSSNGDISFSWRLIFAPLEVVEYVCAHEVTHLKEMSHNKNFWNTLEGLMPDARQHSKWLRTHSQELLRYQLEY